MRARIAVLAAGLTLVAILVAIGSVISSAQVIDATACQRACQERKTACVSECGTHDDPISCESGCENELLDCIEDCG